jgi:putative 4-mercaptohistidine N1-methyltranferase
MPLFWQKDEQGNYLLRTMASLIPMPWNWPVEVNYLEAKAFTNWLSAQTGKQLRLPTEEEWYILRDSVLDTDQPYWNKAPGNINLEYWASPCPVDRFALGDFYDVIGNVWQWTETPIYGFDGFDVHPYYDDFSTPTFDTRHNLIKGGSWISTGNEAIRDSRYAFRRHFYQHAGFRYVDSPAEVKIHEELYETEADVVPWCEEQWTIHPTLGESFSRRLVNHLTPFLVNRAFKSALILGCKTGRLAFELARYCDQVTATDFTARHINVCCDMREKGRIRFVIPSEGEIVTYREAHLEQFGLADLVNKVDFWQADASNLIAKFTGYDLIVAEHLLAETYNPGKFLSMINERLNPDGLLIIADSYPWKQSDLDKSLWVGGIRKDGEPYATLEGLKDLLAPHFDQVAEPMDLPLYLKQDNRNYQLSLCEVTIWKKR